MCSDQYIEAISVYCTVEVDLTYMNCSVEKGVIYV